MKLKDHIATGAILGIILPAITLFVIFQLGYSHMIKLEDFFRFTYAQNILENLVSLTGLPNLALFFLFIQSKLYENAKGVIFSTFILVIVVIVLKFIA